MSDNKKHYNVGDVVQFLFHSGASPCGDFTLHAQVMERYDEDTVKIEFGYWSACDEDPKLYFMRIKESELMDPKPNIAKPWLDQLNENRAERDSWNKHYIAMGWPPAPERWWGEHPEIED